MTANEIEIPWMALLKMEYEAFILLGAAALVGMIFLYYLERHLFRK